MVRPLRCNSLLISVICGTAPRLVASGWSSLPRLKCGQQAVLCSSESHLSQRKTGVASDPTTGRLQVAPCDRVEPAGIFRFLLGGCPSLVPAVCTGLPAPPCMCDRPPTAIAGCPLGFANEPAKTARTQSGTEMTPPSWRTSSARRTKLATSTSCRRAISLRRASGGP